MEVDITISFKLMITEVHSAISFLSSILRPVLSHCTSCQLDAFEQSLSNMLCTKFASHWDESNPIKGNAFRSLMLSCSFVDPILQEAARKCSFEISRFPTELTIWIDPGEVTYRIGENGSIGYLDMLKEKGIQHRQQNKYPPQPQEQQVV